MHWPVNSETVHRSKILCFISHCTPAVVFQSIQNQSNISNIHNLKSAVSKTSKNHLQVWLTDQIWTSRNSKTRKEKLLRENSAQQQVHPPKDFIASFSFCSGNKESKKQSMCNMSNIVRLQLIYCHLATYQNIYIIKKCEISDLSDFCILSNTYLQLLHRLP